MIYSTYTWDLVQALESALLASCKTPATSIDSICSNNHQEETENPEKISDSQQILSHCLGLHYIHRIQRKERQTWKLRNLVTRLTGYDQEEKI